MYQKRKNLLKCFKKHKNVQKRRKNGTELGVWTSLGALVFFQNFCRVKFSEREKSVYGTFVTF